MKENEAHTGTATDIMASRASSAPQAGLWFILLLLALSAGSSAAEERERLDSGLAGQPGLQTNAPDANGHALDGSADPQPSLSQPASDNMDAASGDDHTPGPEGDTPPPIDSGTWYAIGLECGTCMTPAGQTFASENRAARTRFADRLRFDKQALGGTLEERGKEGDFIAHEVAYRDAGDGRRLVVQYVEGEGERVGDAYAYCWVLEPYAANALLYGRKYIVQVYDDHAFERTEDGFRARSTYLSPDLLAKNLLDVRVAGLSAKRPYYQAGEKVRFQFVGPAAFVRETFDADDIRRARDEGTRKERDAKGRLDLAIDLIRQGDASYAAEKLDEALDRYRAASVLAPELAIVHADLGAVYQLLKRLPEAEVSYRLALDLDPDDFDTRFNLAVVLEQLGKKKEAIALYEKIVKERPADREAQERLTALRRTMTPPSSNEER